MISYSHQLHWQSARVTLIRRSATVSGRGVSYAKIMGLVKTINTTTSELKQQSAHSILRAKQRYYPQDDFPLLAVHILDASNPQQAHSFLYAALTKNQKLTLHIAFGGEHAHMANQWLQWFAHRLTLDNTGFDLVEKPFLQEHQLSLKALSQQIKNEPETYHRNDCIQQELAIYADMPIFFEFAKKNRVDSQLCYGLFENVQKRLCDWFPTQSTHIARWFRKHQTQLQSSTVSLIDARYLRISTSSKSSPKKSDGSAHQQAHDGVVGWIYLKGAWAKLTLLWEALNNIHLQGKYLRDNGLAYIVQESNNINSKMRHAFPPPHKKSLWERHVLNKSMIHKAAEEVSDRHETPPELDEKGELLTLEANVEYLFQQLKSLNYQPTPTQAFTIPKHQNQHQHQIHSHPSKSLSNDVRKNQSRTRRLEQLSQYDMIVHRLMHDILSPIIDVHFHQNSLGYRKHRSREQVHQQITKLMQQGYEWVLEADINDFFERIEHDTLLLQLSNLLPQKERLIIQLIGRLIKTPYLDQKNNLHQRNTGLIQGSPLSPSLANLYLNGFDQQLGGQSIQFVRYADDFLIFCKHQNEASAALDFIRQALEQLGLTLAEDKTGIKAVSDGFEFLGFRFGGQGMIDDNAMVPILRQRKPVFVTGNGLFLGVNGGAIEIRGYQKKRKKKNSKFQIQAQKKLIQVIPLRRISEVIVLGNHSISSALMSALAREKISLHMVNHWGFQVGTLSPMNADYFAIAHLQGKQYEQLSPSAKLAIAQDIIQAKIQNYTSWVKNSYTKHPWQIRSKPSSKKLTPLVSDIRCDKQLMRYLKSEELNINLHSTKNIAELMGYEGSVHKLLFTRFRGLIIKEQQSAFYSHKRSRGGVDRLNSLLNFGYYWLFTRISGLLRSHGLNPYLGFVHQDQSYESLVYDVMELFRVHIDKTALRLINRKQLKADDFYRHADKGWRLNNTAIQRYSNQLEATFTASINQVMIHDIVLMQVRIIKQWSQSEGSLVWFRWKTPSSNSSFQLPQLAGHSISDVTQHIHPPQE